ncbi:hypothetical protein BGX26_001186 [Mortierella sp. AD094]|nr:hypothetical protein BGX26_001186 [Mortierella sp. AD094]
MQGQQNNLDSVLTAQDRTVGSAANFSSSSVPRPEDPLTSQTSEVEISSQTQVLSASQSQFFNSQDLVVPVSSGSGSGSGGSGGGGNESTSNSQPLSSPFTIAPWPILVHSTVASSTLAPAPSSVVQTAFGLKSTSEIERLLSIPDRDFQDEVNRILVDPKFPDLVISTS